MKTVRHIFLIILFGTNWNQEKSWTFKSVFVVIVMVLVLSFHLLTKLDVDWHSWNLWALKFYWHFSTSVWGVIVRISRVEVCEIRVWYANHESLQCSSECETCKRNTKTRPESLRKESDVDLEMLKLEEVFVSAVQTFSFCIKTKFIEENWTKRQNFSQTFYCKLLLSMFTSQRDKATAWRFQCHKCCYRAWFGSSLWGNSKMWYFSLFGSLCLTFLPPGFSVRIASNPIITKLGVVSVSDKRLNEKKLIACISHSRCRTYNKAVVIFDFLRASGIVKNSWFVGSKTIGWHSRICMKRKAWV